MSFSGPLASASSAREWLVVPEISDSIAAWSFGWDEARSVSGTEWMTPVLSLMLTDPYHAVRYMAQRSIAKQEGFEHLLASYDFARPMPECNDVMQRIYAAWTNNAASPFRRKAPELLVRDTGELDLETLNRLLLERDDRPVVLNE